MAGDYTLVKISAFYDAFLKHYYKSNRSIKSKSYSEQYSHLMSQGFGWSDFLCRHLRNSGINATEIVSNALPLQRSWAKENGASGTALDIVFEQIRRAKPSVVFFQNTISFNRAWYENLKRAVPSIRYLIGWRCSPYTDADLARFRDFDLILTCNPGIAEHLNSIGITTKVLHHAFEPVTNQTDVFKNVPPPGHDVVFAGSLILAREYHYGRLEFLAELRRMGIPLHIFAERTSRGKRLIKSLFGEIAKTASNLGMKKTMESSIFLNRALQWQQISNHSTDYSMLRTSWDLPVYGNDLFEIMRSSKISLNFHIDSSGLYAGNARLFEATGMGSCLVTDEKKNLSTLFSPDTEVVTYKNATDCAEKIRWLLDHPRERQEIALAGQRRCLREHTFEKRAQLLDHYIQEGLRKC